MSKNKITAAMRVGQAFNKIYPIAIAELEKLARAHLAAHPEYVEFVMAMGGACFKDEEGNYMDAEESGAAELAELLHEWDSTFKFTGDPMRFTAKGPKITNW